MKYVMRLKVSASNDNMYFGDSEPAKSIKNREHYILIDFDFKKRKDDPLLYDIKSGIVIDGIKKKFIEREFVVDYIPDKDTIPREFVEEIYKNIYCYYFNKGYFSILVENFHVDEFRD